MKLYAVDAFDSESWSNRGLPLEERARRLADEWREGEGFDVRFGGPAVEQVVEHAVPLGVSALHFIVHVRRSA